MRRCNAPKAQLKPKRAIPHTHPMMGECARMFARLSASRLCMFVRFFLCSLLLLSVVVCISAATGFNINPGIGHWARD